MKAAVITGNGLEIQDVPKPTPKPNEVLVRVRAAGLSMSGPGDLANRRVGGRSYTTTTVTWLRGILQNDYGADLDAAHWVSFEDPHVAEYVDPTERAPAGRTIIEMLLDGELDVVLGDVTDDPRVSTLFADPAAAIDEWRAKHDLVPINHIVVVTEDTYVRSHLDRPTGQTTFAAYARTFVDYFLLAAMDMRLLSRSNFAYAASLIAPTGLGDLFYKDEDPTTPCKFIPFSIDLIANQ